MAEPSEADVKLAERLRAMAAELVRMGRALPDDALHAHVAERLSTVRHALYVAAAELVQEE